MKKHMTCHTTIKRKNEKGYGKKEEKKATIHYADFD